MKTSPTSRRWWLDPLWWSTALLLALTFGMPHLGPLFQALFPQQERPLYEQASFPSLVLSHVLIVGVSSAIAMVLGCGAGLFVTRDGGRDFRPLLETVVAIGQTFPPVAVLAVAVPLIGFGVTPALIALALYGLLPIVQNTIAGLESVSPAVLEAARGLGMSRHQLLWRVELPLALPVVLAGVRTSVIINIGTAAIASTVGTPTLGSPIIVGLSGFNTAYIVEGALLVGLLAVVTDLSFERLMARSQQWRIAQVSRHRPITSASPASAQMDRGQA